jgi:hypothetical protein
MAKKTGNLQRKMLGAFLIFSWCPPNCDVTFKITNRLKGNNNNFKFNGILKVTSQLRDYLIERRGWTA